MKAQSAGDTTSLEFMKGRRVFEINPDHSIIKNINVIIHHITFLAIRINLMDVFNIDLFFYRLLTRVIQMMKMR